MPMIEPVLTVFINMFKCRQPMFECPLPTNWYDYTQIEVMNTRARSAGLLKEEKVTNLSQIIFTNDAIHIWNLAWKDIKKLVSLYSANKTGLQSVLIPVERILGVFFRKVLMQKMVQNVFKKSFKK